jgi:hypothetical protein
MVAEPTAQADGSVQGFAPAGPQRGGTAPAPSRPVKRP